MSSRPRPSRPPLGDAPAGENPDLSGADERVEGEDGSTSATLFVPRGVGCRQLPASSSTSPRSALGDSASTSGSSARRSRRSPASTTRRAAASSWRHLKLPAVFDTEISENGQKKKVPTFVALGVELSVNEGLKPFSGGFRLNRPIPLGIPGLALEQLSGVADLINDRFGGGFALRLPGGSSSARTSRSAMATWRRSAATSRCRFRCRCSAARSPSPASAAPSRARRPTSARTARRPRRRGRCRGARFFVGPAAGGGNPFQGDMSLTLAGPTVKLAGQLFAVIAEKQVKLGDARVLVSIKPVRFEAEANATLFEIIKAHAFFGIVPEHFTASRRGLDQRAGGHQVHRRAAHRWLLARSVDIGAGAVITLDPPLVKPFTVGLGTGFKPFKFKRIDSVSQFITVKPSAAARPAAGELCAHRRAAAVRLPKSSGDLIVTVTGATRRPRGVRLSMGGKRVRSVCVGSDSWSVQVGLARPPAGGLTVSSRDRIADRRRARARVPLSDPKPGFGTRAQGPVTAGQPVRVCWRVKHAPRGTAVDLFEDQNGNLGTGRSIATGLGAERLLRRPDGGTRARSPLGIRRGARGSQPVSQRWPIPITVVDLTALPAPAATVAPTTRRHDGRQQPVSGAGSYVIRAEPVDDNGDAEPLEYDAPATALSALLSLRAAAWRVTSRPCGAGGGGNASAPQIVVEPTRWCVRAAERHGEVSSGRSSSRSSAACSCGS